MKYLYTTILLFSFISFTLAIGKYHEKVFKTESKFIHDACLTTNGKVIICTDNNSVKAFSMDNQMLLANFTGGHTDHVLCTALSADSTMLASGGGDSTVVIWDFIHQSIMQKITFATGKITSVKFSPNNQFVLIGCSNSKSYLVDIQTQKKIYEFSDHQKDITSVAFSQDGKLIGIAGADKLIRIYNTIDFQLEASLKGHSDWVRAIAFYNNSKGLLSCGDDNKVIRWNLEKINKPTNIKQKSMEGWIISLDIENEKRQNMNTYVVGTMNGKVKISYIFGNLSAKLYSPISKVLILPNKTGKICIAVATLGSGIMLIDASNMQN